MIVLGFDQLDDEGRERLAAAVARVRAYEASLGAGDYQITMMADLTAAAARKRRSRARAKAKIELLRNIPVKRRFEIIHHLIDLGLIGEDQSADDRAVETAVGKFLDQSVTRPSAKW